MATAVAESATTSTTVIRDVAPGVTIFSVPFMRSNLLKLGGVATVVKLQTGALAVISPISLTDDVKAKLQALGGEVKYIVSPNLDHHIHISVWAKEYPAAQVVVPGGLPEKREANPATKGTVYGTVFTAENKSTTSISPEFDADFEYEFIDGSKNKELVLFHKPSATLIEGDVLFNLPAKEAFSKSGVDPSAGIATKLVAGLLQTRNPGWQMKILWHAAASDRARFGQSLKRIQAWEFDRIIPCHGDVIETGGKKVFESVAQLYLKA